MDYLDKMIIQNYENGIITLIEKLYPICRSITGDGNRQTLNILQKLIPLQIKEVKSNTKVYDWIIPKEWNIKDAFIKNSKGKKIIDFSESNLHVVNYSIPVNSKISLAELKNHLYTIPEHPDWIPYRTTYYKEDWGFCLTHNNFLKLKDDEYHVYIESELKDGSLSYGELLIKGSTDEEVLISTHICHPSMCNDNLTGISIATYLVKHLLETNNRYSYRVVFIPATIGAVTWLAMNKENLTKITKGLVIALLGDNGMFHYKKSRENDTEIDKIMQHLLKVSRKDYKILNFEPYGYDERQYCSPGINLPIGRFTRSPNNYFPEYHSSADNLEFLSNDKLIESFKFLLDVIYTIEQNEKYVNLYPFGEPQLGRRGIYNSIAGEINEFENALLWILNYSDKNFDLVDIAIKSKISFESLVEAKNVLLKHKLIKRLGNK